MFWKRGLMLALTAVLLLVLATAGYSQFTQLRYVKTTDFGVTWSAPTQAGDVAVLWQTTTSLPDFSAIAMNNNELCYAVFLPGAPTPGVYAFAGPNFTPVLIMAQGSNNFGGTGSGSTGWANVGKTPNGDIFVLIWGSDANANNTLWGAKSTDNAATWSTFVVGAEPTLPAGSADFQLSDLNSANWCFVQFHIADGTQYVMRFPTAGGQGTFVNLNQIDGSAGPVSYYIGQCKPIAYDPNANALFCCWRNSDLSGVGVAYSGDMGLTFTTATVTGSQRYPSMALRMDNTTPFVISNVGVPAVGARHWSWYSFDEFGYNGGSWTAPDTIAAVTYQSPGPLLYVNQAYFWNATQGVASHNLWGSYTPEGDYTSRTANGGTAWTDFTLQWEWQNNGFDPGSTCQNEIVGAGNGIAYIIFCARVGAPDTDGPTFSDYQLLTPATNLPPYSLSAYVLDPSGNNDITDIHITYWSPQHAGGAPDTLSSDSSTGLDVNQNGTFFFHIPTTIGGGTIAQGDTVWYYFWGRDLAGNSGASAGQAIVAGIAWLAADNPPVAAPTTYALHANYPNPFNPETQIGFDLAATSKVTLTVYNTLGQVVAKLADHQSMNAGTYSLSFNGANLPSGVYLYRLEAGNFAQTRKMVLVK